MAAPQVALPRRARWPRRFGVGSMPTWRPSNQPGSEYRQKVMASVEWVTMAAGATLLDHTHRANHMLVVLDGEIHEDGQVYQAGDIRISAPPTGTSPDSAATPTA